MDLIYAATDDYLGLTNITLSDGKIRISLDRKEETWLKQYDCSGKVIIEIWSKSVVLEAEKFKINDEIYTL
ncbi:YxiG family protein [Candidatus Enterococcus palustris]|uniref:YxiG family protein n=1 Tax=Candidatus Enterococcus palustris TaxID=1834189 RepID=UPI000A348241|nr:hypothetical protein [Enterococcus sp. 7F3_DIV0205]